jgi:hypothetical protein
MLAARVSNPGSGDPWLGDLIKKINRITGDLQKIVSRIESDPYPREDDVKQAFDLVNRLYSLIREQVLPRRLQLGQRNPATGSADGLNKALDALDRSGKTAQKAMIIYSETLGNETRQRANERRSNTRFASDQGKLQDLRFNAAGEVTNLLIASQGFMRFISQ